MTKRKLFLLMTDIPDDQEIQVSLHTKEKDSPDYLDVSFHPIEDVGEDHNGNPTIDIVVTK